MYQSLKNEDLYTNQLSAKSAAQIKSKLRFNNKELSINNQLKHTPDLSNNNRIEN